MRNQTSDGEVVKGAQMTATTWMAAAMLIGWGALLGLYSRDAAAASRSAAQSRSESLAGLAPDIYPDSRARLPKIKRDELNAEGKRVYALLVNPGSRYRDGLRGPVEMWMYSPPMAEHMFAASAYLRYGTGFDQRLTELAILVTARALDAQYEWTAHEPSALKAGLEPAIIDIVKHRKSADGLGKAEMVIIQFGRELVGKRQLSSETFAKALAMFGRQGVTDLAGLMAYYTFNATIISAFDVHLPLDQKPLLP